MLILLSTISLFAGALALPPPQADGRARIRIQQRIVIRVPRLTAVRTSVASMPLPPIRWVERDAGRCVPVDSLTAAAVTRADSIDLVLSGGKRLRASLGDQCPALDFYNGFYLRRTSDGMVCAERDSLQSRSGSACRIQSFRALVPAR